MLLISKIPRRTTNQRYVCFGKHEFREYGEDCEYTQYCPENSNYIVSINGQSCPVHSCRVSAIPFNRPWPGKQRSFEQSESAGFINFYADESVEIRMKRRADINSVKVLPASREIAAEVTNDEIIFTLSEPGKYVLEFNGKSNHALHIFYNPIKPQKQEEKITQYFGPGVHFSGTIYLKDNDVVYIDKEAIVFGSIFTMGAKNVKIYGGGIIDNSCEERISEECYEPFTKGCFRIYNCQNIVVEDIIFTNSSSWTMAIFDSKNIRIHNVKIVGQWRYNTDGIDIVNSSSVKITDSFIRSFDDTISLKGIYDY